MRPLFPHQAEAIGLLRSSLARETWRTVVGYEGFYEVSDLGRVRSISRELVQQGRWGVQVRRLECRVLAQTVDRGAEAYGRLQVKLSAGGRARTRLVHHLVAEAFIGPRAAGMEVAHGDGDASNNILSNLRYATPKENTGDKVVHGTVLRGERVGNSKLTADAVRVIRASQGAVKNKDLSERFGISPAQVTRIQQGSRWGHVDA